MSKPSSLQPFLDFTVQTAYMAGRATLGYFQTDLITEYKSDLTPVTAADRASENLIRAQIEQRYPDHAIIGEEFGENSVSGSSYKWIIDPIDGTKSFIRGVPLYAVLIGLEIDGVVRVGAAYFPALDEMIAAADGEGCWWNGRKAHVSPVSTLDKGVVTFTDLNNFTEHGRQDAWDRICKRAYYRAGWTDAYGYALVATGRTELALDPIMNLWDCGPFPPILREAGGYFGDWQGNETIYGGEALATSQALLPEVLELIRGD